MDPKTDSMILDGSSIEIGLRVIGVWPDSSCTVLRHVFWISLTTMQIFDRRCRLGVRYKMTSSQCLTLLLVIVRSQKRLTIAAGKVMDVSLKGFTAIFYDILLAMEEHWNNVDIYDKSVSYIMSGNADLSRRCSNVLISINVAAVICYCMTTLVRRETEFNEDLNISLRVLPVQMEFPFEVDVSPRFELLALVQIFYAVSIASLVAMINCLIITLVLHVSGQIDILCRELLTICGDKTSQRFSIAARVRLLISRHQRIITLSDNIQELYSEIALMQFLSNTVVMCCIGFTFIGSVGKDGAAALMLKSAIFYVSITLEAFIFCFAGEYLSAKSKSIGDAVYEALWYNMPPAECQILLFVILRSQKRLTITAGKIMDLSLKDFTSVMKASASYMSVLHAMY